MWRSNYTRYHCTRRFIARSEFPPLSSQSPGSLNVTENESERDFKKRLLETVNDEYLEWDCGYVIYRFADVGNSSLECECLIAIGELTPVQPVPVNADTLLATPLTECECVVFERARKDGFLVRFDMSELLSETAESVEKKCGRSPRDFWSMKSGQYLLSMCTRYDFRISSVMSTMNDYSPDRTYLGRY